MDLQDFEHEVFKMMHLTKLDDPKAINNFEDDLKKLVIKTLNEDDIPENDLSTSIEMLGFDCPEPLKEAFDNAEDIFDFPGEVNDQ